MIYTETQGGSFTSEDGLSIPNDPANRHYQQMLAEVTAGESTITPYANSTAELEQLRADAYAANAAHAAMLEDNAQHNPSLGVILDDRKAAKENGKSKLTDADDHLSVYVDDVLDVLETADEDAGGASRAELVNWTPTAYSWPGWVAQ
jgi:hypothetical protein